MFADINKTWSSLANRFVDFISFDRDVRRLVNVLNRKIEQKEDFHPLTSHPNGFKREIAKRRIRIALAYINIVQQLESEKYEERLQALETLINEAFYAKNVAMPLNTARIQAALMKEVVKDKGNLRKQLEFMTDFTRASYGQSSVIQNLLRKMSLIVVPETGKKLCEMELGWDGHVHDNLSEGRKTPSQVMLDAFIKGISELTLAYYDFADTRIIQEAIGASEILGIRVSIGIEFSVGKSGQREHFMYLLPYFTTLNEYMDFLSREEYKFFREGLKENATRREATIRRMLINFNENCLQELNFGNLDLTSLTLKPLLWEDLRKIVLEGQASRKHLGELLYRMLKPVLYRRVLALKAQYETLQDEVREKRKSRTDLHAIAHLYHITRSKFEELTPEKLRLKYFENKAAFDYDSAFSKEDILKSLVSAGGETIYIHPLEVGIQHAITTIIIYHKYIMQVETFNMQDSMYRNPLEYHMLNNFISLLNRGPFEDLKKFRERCHLSAISEEELLQAWEYYHNKPLITRCGSDSTGRDPKIPGMGFIRLAAIPEKSSRNSFYTTHTEIPVDIDLSLGKKPGEQDEMHRDLIISLGKTSDFKKNPVGDEEHLLQIDFKSFWTYLNPTLKNLMKVSVGCIPAYLMINMYTIIWFGITFIRNVIADLTSNSGFDPREWKTEDINFENAANSLFWTGFSVPLLKTVDLLFDKTCLMFFVTNDIILRWGKFLILSFINGSYLYTHNSLRGFMKNVKKMNFFRSILSFPFASLFSYLLDFLGVSFIPKVVQTKFWSDVVAGVIEGTGKYMLIEKLRNRDFLELLPLLDDPDQTKRSVASFDLLYIWAILQRGKSTLNKILVKDKKILEKLHHHYLDEGTMEEILETVITYYQEEEALLLTDIIGTYYSQFTTWLIKLYKSSM